MKSYDQLKTETAKAYGVFTEFLHLGPDRAVVKVAKIADKSAQSTYIMSSKYNWEDRAKDYDHDLFLDTMKFRREELLLKQQEILENGFDDYYTLLKHWRDKYADVKISVSDKALKDAANSRLAIENLGRKAAGLPNTYLQTNVQPASEDQPIRLDMGSSPKIIPAKVDTTVTKVQPPQPDED